MDRQAILQVFAHGKPVTFITSKGNEYPGIIDGLPWNRLGETAASPDMVLVYIPDAKHRGKIQREYRYKVHGAMLEVPIDRLRIAL